MYFLKLVISIVLGPLYALMCYPRYYCISWVFRTG